MKTEKDLLSKKQLMEIFLKHRVDSPYPGDWESIFKGSGYEFWSLKELQPTDPFKNIDWKSKAKTGKYYVREYLAESYFNLMILYDISKSVSFGRKELLQANIAVSLAYSAIITNNGCGLIMFADEVTTYIPPRMGWSHFMLILKTIALSQPLDCTQTNLNYALKKLVNEFPESLSFVISDFMYPFECEYNFQRTLHGITKHEVKALQILEDFEYTLPSDSKGLLCLYDFENNETIILDLSKWESYGKEMARRLDETQHRLNKAGIDLLRLTPSEDYASKINAFMQGYGTST